MNELDYIIMRERCLDFAFQTVSHSESMFTVEDVVMIAKEFENYLMARSQTLD